jgi:ActR/RegA family two-component response regulator
VTQEFDTANVLLGSLVNELANIAMVVQPALLALEDVAQKDPGIGEHLGVLTSAVERIVGCARGTSVLIGEHEANTTIDTLQVLEHFIDTTVEDLPPRQRFFSRVAQGLWPIQIFEEEFLLLCKNLVDHALRTASGGSRIRLEADNVTADHATNSVTGLPAGEYVRIRVCVDGLRIGEDPQGTLESSFSSASRSESIWGGLGMAQARAICRRAGGLITLRSENHQGTATVWLPNARCAPASRRSRANAAARLESAIFLVVDDEELILTSLARNLTSLGHVVYLAQDAATALAILAEEARVDFALVDLHLGRDSGLRLAREMEVRFPALGIIISTGFSGTVGSGSDAMTKQDPFPVLIKPFGTDELMAAVGQLSQKE